MSALVYRATKGSGLTNAEIDGNMAELDAMLQRRSGLTHLISLSLDRMWRDVYAGGDRPAFMNQQWGGAQWGAELVDGATGQLYKFDVADGQIQDDAAQSLTGTTATQLDSMGFKVGDSQTPPGVWVKMFKVGNPTDSIMARVWSDNGSGSPNVALGALASISAKQITSKPDGEWYFFPVTFPALTAGTQYHLVLSRSGAADITNYFSIKCTGANKNPHGFMTLHNGSTWVQYSSYALCFLIPNATANTFFRSGGQFGGKLVFAEGAPLNQSKALINPLKNFFDPQEPTLLHRVSSCVKGKPIADYLYGLDHDRILLMCDAGTGYASIRLWKQDGTLLTVTGNTDVSGSGLSDIAINFRAMGDGADYLKLTVNGTQQAALTNQTITFDPLMRELGHRWLGGGFQVVTWTQKLDMTSLPSANGWTWTGTGTEANCMSVSGGRLYQNKNGYGATDSGYYSKTVAPAFNNGTGWAIAKKYRVTYSVNLPSSGAIYFGAADTAKGAAVCSQGYFLQLVDGLSFSNLRGSVQCDLQSADNVIALSVKGSDAYVFINGRLLFDATAQITTAYGGGNFQFGDANSNSGENADVSYDYVSHTTSGPIIPQIATGMALHEYAHWSGDKSTYLANLYNSGSPISVKKFAGMQRNYVDVVEWAETRRGITWSPTTTSTTYVTANDLECFVLGDKFRVEEQTRSTNSGVNNNYLSNRFDGVIDVASTGVTCPAASAEATLKFGNDPVGQFGMHKVEGVFAPAAGTMTLLYQARTLTVKGAK